MAYEHPHDAANPRTRDAGGNTYAFRTTQTTDLEILIDGAHGGGERDYTVEFRPATGSPPVTDWEWDANAAAEAAHVTTFHADYLL